MTKETFIRTETTRVGVTTISDIDEKVRNVTNETDAKLQKLAKETDAKIHKAIQDYDAELKPLAVVVGAHPKKQHKNKFIQWLLIKLFGYELEYKAIMTRIVDVCQWCFEEPSVEGKCVCQSCIDWAKYERDNAREFDLDEWLDK